MSQVNRWFEDHGLPERQGHGKKVSFKVQNRNIDNPMIKGGTLRSLQETRTKLICKGSKIGIFCVWIFVIIFVY